ncbi:hypothetical protein QQZ08_010559 [Neonectria magnoliae]|uniref:Uncharacterized protein n=1 Tax=Neonectria magnoliae TaxID=2732573 RepID=A0ABR1HG95_9HYPO
MPPKPDDRPKCGKVTSIAVIDNLLGKDKVIFQNGEAAYDLRIEPRSIISFDTQASNGPTDPGTVGREPTYPSWFISIVGKDLVRVDSITDDPETLQIELPSLCLW